MRKKLCETLVLPIANYCNLCYVPCLDQMNLYRIQKIQNSCCRYIFNLRKYDHISSKIVDLGWLGTINVYKYNLSVFVHRLLTTSSPSYLRDKLQFRYNVHDVNLRQVHKLSLLNHHTAIFKRSFSYNSVVIYNNIDDNLKQLSVNSFRKNSKHQFLQNQ